LAVLGVEANGVSLDRVGLSVFGTILDLVGPATTVAKVVLPTVTTDLLGKLAAQRGGR
jgi:hypothetical protein